MDKEFQKQLPEEFAEYHVILYPDPRLTAPCEEVQFPLSKANIELYGDILPAIIAVCKTYNGVGLAANQVGVMKKFFLMVPPSVPYYFCFNPKIIRTGKDDVKSVEGCLSAPGQFFPHIRKRVIDVEYQDMDGKRVTRTLKGMEAIIFQHELMHISGQSIIPNDTTNKEGQASAASQATS